MELDVEGGVLVGSETGVEDYWEQSCGWGESGGGGGGGRCLNGPERTVGCACGRHSGDDGGEGGVPPVATAALGQE